MKIKCILVDDEPVALLKMKKYVEQTPYLELVALCDNPMEAKRIMAETPVDALFTDISMLGQSGLDFVASLPKKPLVVFVTAYMDYAVDSYKIGAVDYIVKPYGLKEFQRAADRLRVQYEMMQQCNASAQSNSIFVRADGKWIRINTDSIRYIQGMSDYLRVYTTESHLPIVTYATFAHMRNSLPAHFLQVHRSWIVNMEQIVEIAHNRIQMDENTSIPIGETYKEDFMSYLQNRSIGKTSKN